MNKKQVKSLNALYAENTIVYWCNACGDINMPGDPHDRLVVHTPEEFPPALKELYERYFDETNSLAKYVVTIEGKNGIAIGALCDYEFASDLLNRYEITKETPYACREMFTEEFHEAVLKTAEALMEHLKETSVDADVIFGNGTDPDGDEILVFFPKENCEGYVDCGGYIDSLSKFIYSHIAEEFVKGCCPNMPQPLMDLIKQLRAKCADTIDNDSDDEIPGDQLLPELFAAGVNYGYACAIKDFETGLIELYKEKK